MSEHFVSTDVGGGLVKFARNVVEGKFTRVKPKIPKNIRHILSEKRGVFVSLHRDHGLRGSAGFLDPNSILGIALERAAYIAAFEDSRFPKLREDELGKTIFEVSLLTKAKLVTVKDPLDYLKKVVVGRDGLMIQRGENIGVVLPQVPWKNRWGTEEFIQHACVKANLMPDEWKKKGFKLSIFHAEVFKEKTPKGGAVKLNAARRRG